MALLPLPRAVFALGLLCAAAPLAAQEPRFLSPREVDRLPSAPADHRGAYGADSLQFGELRLPGGRGPFPVAVVVHGGCWLSGFATLQNTAALADALRREGIATWNVEYRRIDHPGGGWPGTFTDVGAATDHVRELARRFPLDTTRVVMVGHSAGAPLAAWAAVRDGVAADSPVRPPAPPLRVRGSVVLGGPMTFAPFIGLDQEICGAPVISQLLGGLPGAVPERYRAVSATELMGGGSRARLLAGEHDPVVPQAPTRTVVERVRASGADVTYTRLPGASHFEVVAPTSSAWPAVLAAVREMLAPGA